MDHKDILYLTSADTKKLQKDLLKILIEFDRICKKNNIPYFLYGGTLLGAVRHEGFIPWDDDIDVAMFREDYNRLKKIIKDELDTDNFFFQSQETDLNYNWVFSRLRMNNTVYKRAGQEHLNYHDGFFIDIFPLDDISANKFKQSLTIYMCKFSKKILWSPVGVLYGKNFLHRLVFKILKLIPRKVAISLYDFFATKFNRKNSKFAVSHNAFTLVVKKEWYKETVKLNFEGLKFNAPIGYHEFLQARYGDYMELPPKEERIGHHYVSYIKFSDGEELIKSKHN